jgi:quercetin dioxygenase-like cupin family protein
MQPLGIHHYFADGVYAKEMRIPPGNYVTKHVHDYDHLSILSIGEVLVDTGENKRRYVAPTCITIKKGVKHTITALEFSIWYCIHATDETDPRNVDRALIREEA